MGVFVNEDKNTIKKTVSQAGIDVIQLHGEEPPNACKLSEHLVIKAIRG